MAISAWGSPRSGSGIVAVTEFRDGSFHNRISVSPLLLCQMLLSLPRRPSIPVILACNMPNMQSNDRFSSMRATTCRMSMSFSDARGGAAPPRPRALGLRTLDHFSEQLPGLAVPLLQLHRADRM